MSLQVAVGVLEAGVEVLENLGLERTGGTTLEEVMAGEGWGVLEREGRAVIAGGFAGMPPEAQLLTQLTGEGAVSGVWATDAQTFALTDTRPGHELQWVWQQGEELLAEGTEGLAHAPAELDEESLWALLAARTGLPVADIAGASLTRWTSPDVETLPLELSE